MNIHEKRPLADIINLLQSTTCEQIFWSRFKEIEDRIDEEVKKTLQVDFYRRLINVQKSLLQRPLLSDESRNMAEAKIAEYEAKLALLGVETENHSNITTQPDTKVIQTENISRMNKVVNNLPELKSNGIATELTGSTDVYARSQYNYLNLMYPNLPPTHVVVAECNFYNIRFDSFSCMNLAAMRYHYNRYSTGLYSAIKWYSVPINELS